MKRFTLAAALILLAGPPSLADSIDQNAAREAVKKGDIRPLAEAIAKVEQDYQSRVLDAELEHEGGIYVYEIKAINKDGWRRKLYLDAKTLDILKEKSKPPKKKD
ncbi:MAG: PepSY domain-containing protein [Rhodospirillales bacterium]|nr:PepSY domain-containing protein [Rhodospirillales bacterium]